VYEVVRYPSLELNWLPNSDRKGLSDPAIIHGEDGDTGGGYYSADKYNNFERFDNRMVHMRRGVIYVDHSWGDHGFIPAVIAHEFRHHYQHVTLPNRLLCLSPVHDWYKTEGRPYNERIIRHFLFQWLEWDAFRYEARIMSTEENVIFKRLLFERYLGKSLDL